MQSIQIIPKTVLFPELAFFMGYWLFLFFAIIVHHYKRDDPWQVFRYFLLAYPFLVVFCLLISLTNNERRWELRNHLRRLFRNTCVGTRFTSSGEKSIFGYNLPCHVMERKYFIRSSRTPGEKAHVDLALPIKMELSGIEKPFLHYLKTSLTCANDIIAYIPQEKLVPRETHKKWFQVLREFSLETDDFQHFQDSSVQDVIDPSLYGSTNGDWIASSFSPKLQHFTYIHNVDNVSDTKGEVKHMEIVKVMNEQRIQVMQTISELMMKMLPGFERLLEMPLEEDIKVFVKYKITYLSSSLKPGLTHSEGGEMENIIAVGVYWLYIDEDIKNGDLELLVPVNVHVPPKKGYNKCSGTDIWSRQFPAKQGQCMFFNNLDVYHRVTDIDYLESSKTAKCAERHVVAFFLSAPWAESRSLPTDRNTCSISEARKKRDQWRNTQRTPILEPSFNDYVVKRD